ncbi:hypothetical protein D3C85_363810 [compost metagenome]
MAVETRQPGRIILAAQIGQLGGEAGAIPPPGLLPDGGVVEAVGVGEVARLTSQPLGDDLVRRLHLLGDLRRRKGAQIGMAVGVALDADPAVVQGGDLIPIHRRIARRALGLPRPGVVLSHIGGRQEHVGGRVKRPQDRQRRLMHARQPVVEGYRHPARRRRIQQVVQRQDRHSRFQQGLDQHMKGLGRIGQRRPHMVDGVKGQHGLHRRDPSVCLRSRTRAISAS